MPFSARKERKSRWGEEGSRGGRCNCGWDVIDERRMNFKELTIFLLVEDTHD